MVSHTLRLLVLPLDPPLLFMQRPPTTSTLLEPPTKSTAQPCLLRACKQNNWEGIHENQLFTPLPNAGQAAPVTGLVSGLFLDASIVHLVPPLGTAMPVCVCEPARGIEGHSQLLKAQ